MTELFKPADLAKGQVWVHVETKQAYLITSVSSEKVYYYPLPLSVGRKFGPMPCSRIQWDLDVFNGALVRGAMPDEE